VIGGCRGPSWSPEEGFGGEKKGERKPPYKNVPYRRVGGRHRRLYEKQPISGVGNPWLGKVGMLAANPRGLEGDGSEARRPAF